jgi:hypothetical protein
VRRLVCPTAVLALLAIAAPGATAAIVTVGPPLDQAQPSKGSVSDEPFLIANASLPPTLNRTSPVAGRVIRWRINATAGGPFRLRILRHEGGLVYTTLGVSEPVSSPAPSPQTFSTSIPIQVGDTIGLEAVEPADDQFGLLIGDASLSFTFWSPRPPDGVPTAGATPDEEEGVPLNADVQPTPTVTSVTPAAGNIRGGTTITLAGTDFTDVSALSIGGKTVTSFTVDSESRITTVTPGFSRPGPVGISVTTPGGTSPFAGPQYTYTACRVPKLTGKRLKRVRKRLRRARCKLGKVKLRGSTTAREGRVVGQRPPSGKLKPPGAKVTVTLG